MLAVKNKEMHIEHKHVIYVKYDRYVIDTVKCTIRFKHLVQHLIVVLMV